MNGKVKLSQTFNEVVAITDDTDHLWMFLKSVLEKHQIEHVRIPTVAPIRQSWPRFKNSPHIIVPWESALRKGGAIIEEFLDVAPHFAISKKIIVITTNPTHEDVIYMNELGIKKIICLRYRDKELRSSAQELAAYLKPNKQRETSDEWWHKVLRTIDLLPENLTNDPRYQQLENKIYQRMEREGGPSARFYDAMGGLKEKRNQLEDALGLYDHALELNPNYFRAYRKVANLHKKKKNYDRALQFMKKMQAWNRDSISRLCDMGDLHLECGDDQKAYHCFQSAVEKDSFCSRALNGIAEIEFRKGDLETSRSMLRRSNLAYRIAHKLNLIGVKLVKENQFAKALDHYIKAQYVIPQQNKGPMLFYNMGLCYSRWNKPKPAKEFLRLALIKEPNYAKANRLLAHLNESEQDTAHSSH